MGGTPKMSLYMNMLINIGIHIFSLFRLSTYTYPERLLVLFHFLSAFLF